MSVIALGIHIVCALVPVAEPRLIVEFWLTVTVDVLVTPHPVAWPCAVSVYVVVRVGLTVILLLVVSGVPALAGRPLIPAPVFACHEYCVTCVAFNSTSSIAHH